MKMTKNKFSIVWSHAFLSLLIGSAIVSLLCSAPFAIGIHVDEIRSTDFSHIAGIYGFIVDGVKKILGGAFFVWLVSLAMAGLPGIVLWTIALSYLYDAGKKILWYPLWGGIMAKVSLTITLLVTGKIDGMKDIFSGLDILCLFYGAFVGLTALWLDKDSAREFKQNLSNPIENRD